MPFLPTSNSYRMDFPKVDSVAEQVVLSFQGAGLNLGTNLGISLRSADGELLYQSQPKKAVSRLRTASLRDIVISLLRATATGLRLEYELRKRKGGGLPRFSYEIPAQSVRGLGPITLELRRILRNPVFVTSVKLESTRTSANALNPHSAPIDAYALKTSIEAGGKAELCLHSNVGPLDCELIHFEKQAVSVTKFQGLEITPRTVPTSAYVISPNWPVSIEIAIPSDCSGLYGVKVSSVDNPEHQMTVPLVARKSLSMPKADVLVIACTNTWSAYNEWGGASLYDWIDGESLGRERAKQVTKLRPNPKADLESGRPHLARGLRELICWLENQDVSFDIVDDDDVEQHNQPFNEYKTVILDCHAEYWTEKSVTKLKTYIADGGALISFSGNALFWRTQLLGDKIEVTKPSGLHSDGEPGGLWADLGRSESHILGTAYTGYGANTYAPYEVIEPDHWTFNGTGLGKGEQFGHEGTFGAASGHETDKMNRHSPKNTLCIARGTNAKGGGAHMTILENPGCGIVFSTGSISYAGCLSRDKTCSRIITNILARVGVSSKSNG